MSTSVTFVNLSKIMSKRIIGIRHAEAVHNVLGLTKHRDSTLTAKGMYQATQANVPEVDIVLVSPLTRALQTAQLMYPDAPTVALDCLKQIPQHTDVCNKRQSKTVLQTVFPNVNFENMSEYAPWPSHLPPKVTRYQFDNYVDALKENDIAVISHSSWLTYYMTGKTFEHTQPELEYCFPYKMAYGI